MDVVVSVLQICIRSLFLLSPVAVAGLAYRRLVLSKSANAWVYAAVALFATLTAVSVLPWAIGADGIKWFALILSLICPLLWVGVVLLCDAAGGARRYESTEEEPDDQALPVFKSYVNDTPASPLILESPDWPGAPKAAFFRTDRGEGAGTSGGTPKRDVFAIVREMRGNKSSEARRPRLLPPPSGSASFRDMPFIR